jgi:hypothetical protein
MGEVSGSWFIDEEELTTRRPRGHMVEKAIATAEVSLAHEMLDRVAAR